MFFHHSSNFQWLPSPSRPRCHSVTAFAPFLAQSWEMWQRPTRKFCEVSHQKHSNICYIESLTCSFKKTVRYQEKIWKDSRWDHAGHVGRLGRQAGGSFFEPWLMTTMKWSSPGWPVRGRDFVKEKHHVTQLLSYIELLHVNWEMPYLSSNSFEWQAEHPDQRHETGQWQLWPCNWKFSNKSAWMRHEFDSASGDFELCQDVDVCRCLQDLDEKKDREADAQVLWVVSVDATVPCNIIFVRNMMWYIYIYGALRLYSVWHTELVSARIARMNLNEAVLDLRDLFSTSSFSSVQRPGALGATGTSDFQKEGTTCC